MPIIHDIKASVIGPESVQVRVVREDYLGMANHYRMLFEVGLAGTSATLGMIFQKLEIIPPQVILFVFFAAAIVAGLVGNHKMKQKSRENSHSPDSASGFTPIKTISRRASRKM